MKFWLDSASTQPRPRLGLLGRVGPESSKTMQ